MNKLLSMLNPQAVQMIQSLMKKGANPKTIIIDMIKSGQLTKDKFQQVKNTIASYSNFLPNKISNEDWKEFEDLFSNESNIKSKFRL